MAGGLGAIATARRSSMPSSISIARVTWPRRWRWSRPVRVSHRSLFRYFEDLDELCRVAIEREDAAIQHLIPIADAGLGPLDKRIDGLLTRRSALYEATAPVARVGRMRAPRIPVLAENLERSRRLLNDQVRAQFAPELGLLPPDQAEAILTGHRSSDHSSHSSCCATMAAYRGIG